ncbi:hypothetical protein BCT97_007770 [Vibrio breoganii]|uniref:hypothetical protein n=1 Tax=Vibrio TaxID=662 RepID=UPI0013000236|nr:hypothetical protein [Vibrio breoganii]
MNTFDYLLNAKSISLKISKEAILNAIAMRFVQGDLGDDDDETSVLLALSKEDFEYADE